MDDDSPRPQHDVAVVRLRKVAGLAIVVEDVVDPEARPADQ
jgi:hypothetical protein